jgi:hypothetical protein
VEIVQVREKEWLLDPYFQLCVILVFSAAILDSSWFQTLQICRASLVLFLATSDLPSLVVFSVISESFFFVSDIGFLVQLLAVSDLGFLLLFSVVSYQSFCCYSWQLLASESGVYPSSIALIPCQFQFQNLFLFSFIMSSDKLDLFHIRLNGKNYSAWEFQFQLFVKGKELWGHINGSNPALTDADAFSRWKIMDARVMTWILSSIEPHLVLNLRPYKTVAAIWNYLNKVYNQDNTARRFQLEYEMANFTQESLSIEEYFSGFQNLWANYSDIVYANVPTAALSAVQAMHDTRQERSILDEAPF